MPMGRPNIPIQPSGIAISGALFQNSHAFAM